MTQPIHLTAAERLAEKQRRLLAGRASRRRAGEERLAEAGFGHLAGRPRIKAWVHVGCLLAGSASPRKVVAQYGSTCPRCHGRIIPGRDNVAAVWEAPIEA